MYSIEFTNKYLSDLKLARKRKLDESELNIVIEKLSSGDEPLPIKYKDHNLSGNYSSYRECHIQPDWLLIYKKEKVLRILKLYRTGSHSDLF
ncbi:MAG: type II toxin-antitoxin system YafQ family toxin [Bacteroidales bacterium]|nr:type II toxin-antitoxin system YafQ family toxin [Bacteroidales bacterium]